MLIDANTSRQDLIDAILGTWDGIQFCLDRNIDPQDETVATETIRQLCVDFVLAGDECAAC